MREVDDWTTARSSILLKSMPDDALARIRQRSAPVVVERGATIFLQGEPANMMYIVLDGWVKLYRVAMNGVEAVVGVFTRGQSIGEAVAFEGTDYPVTAQAVTSCRLWPVDAGLLLELMKSRPELAMALLAATFQHLHQLVTQIEQLKAQTGSQRVAEFLIDLCHVSEGACTVTLPYDKVLIAGRLGMQPESLSRAFVRLRAQGVFVRQNHAVIEDVARLRDFVEWDRNAAWERSS